MLTFKRIYSLNEVDFSTLVYDSLPEMDSQTYVWRKDVDTPEKKVLFIQNLLRGNLTDKDLFMYKGTENDKDLSLLVGKLKDGEFTVYFSFISPNANGSKSWIYYDSTMQARQQFYDSVGIQKIKFNYVDTSDFGRKITTVLGNQWNTEYNGENDKQINPSVTVKGFTASLN